MGLFQFFSSLNNKRKVKQQERKLRQEQEQARIQQLLNDASALEQQGNDDAAEKIYLEICKKSPEAAISYLRILKRQNHYKDLFFYCETFKSLIIYNKGYSPAFRIQAECFRDGLGTEKNLEKAYKTMKKYLSYAKAERDASVHAFLGDCAMEIGNKMIQNAFDLDTKNKALSWITTANLHLMKAAECGDIPSMLKLATDRRNDADTVFKYYNKAFHAGVYEAAAEIFWRFIHAYQQNLLPNSFNMEILVKQLTKGAEARNPDCMLALALCYSKGFVGHFGFRYGGTHTRYMLQLPFSPNPDKFFYWLKKAYDSGCTDPSVQIMMAEYISMGKIWNRPEFNEPPSYVAKEFESDPKTALTMIEQAKQHLDMNSASLGDNPRRTYWYEACIYLLTALTLDCFGKKSDLKKACEYIGAEYNGVSLILPKYNYTKIISLRKALNRAYGFHEDSGYYAIICEEDD